MPKISMTPAQLARFQGQVQEQPVEVRKKRASKDTPDAPATAPGGVQRLWGRWGMTAHLWTWNGKVSGWVTGCGAVQRHRRPVMVEGLAVCEECSRLHEAAKEGQTE